MGNKVARADAVANRDLIVRTVRDHFERTGTMPAQAEVARKLNLSANTVNKHWSALGEDFKKVVAPYRVLTPKVIEAHFTAATDPEKGTAKDRELWYKYVEGVNMGDDDGGGGIQINIVTSSEATIVQVKS